MANPTYNVAKRKIPASGINLFQLIYILIREYEESSGKKALNLSLGNPDLVPPPVIRELKSKFQLRSDLELHTYAEDKNLNRFCEGMIQAFTGIDLDAYPNLRAVPIGGIKTATAILPLACGLHLSGNSGGKRQFNVVSHLPAYDMIGTWSGPYLNSNRIVWPLSGKDSMRINLDSLKAALKDAKIERPDLIFVIRPGNPASCGASRKEWEELIRFCIERGTRLVNDGAYTTLSDGSHVPLAQVAKDHPELEWAEMLSMSKSFSDPGARLGVLFGSREFVEDFVLVKGNTDSGPVPTLMAAYGEFFKNQDEAKKALRETYAIYRARLDYLIPKLKSIGLRMACETTAGFFTLWKTPDFAFDRDLREESLKSKIPRAELFNRLVIEKTGIVGVHFDSSESFIRYAVCTDVLDPEFKSRFEEAIARIQPRYAGGENA